MSAAEAASVSPTRAVPVMVGAPGAGKFARAATVAVASLVSSSRFPASSVNSASPSGCAPAGAPRASGSRRSHRRCPRRPRGRSPPTGRQTMLRSARRRPRSPPPQFNVSPTCAVPSIVGAPVAGLFSGSWLAGPATVAVVAFGSGRPSGVQIAPAASQSVVAGSSTVTSSADDGCTLMIQRWFCPCAARARHPAVRRPQRLVPELPVRQAPKEVLAEPKLETELVALALVLDRHLYGTTPSAMPSTRRRLRWSRSPPHRPVWRPSDSSTSA